MEIAAFFRFLSKNLSVLILIPIVTVIITYFLVKSLPDVYESQAQIATGIVDKSEEIDLSEGPPLQQNEIEQRFGNLIQKMQMNKMLSIISYRLIIHDLDPTSVPFKKPSSMVEGLTTEQRNLLIDVANRKHRAMQPLSSGNKDEAALNAVLGSMQYDPGSIKKDLTVSRIMQSDYIQIIYKSSDPNLSAFVVNTLCREFINFYTRQIKATGENKVNYLSDMLAKKQNDLNAKMGVLKYYKIQNNVLNLPEQARIIFGQMIDVEARQSELQREIIATAATIRNIDNKFNRKDRQYFEATASKVNSEIATFKEKAKVLSDKYIDSDFDPVYKKMYDSLQVLTTSKINDGTDQHIFNPFAVKQDLIAKKINLQTELDLSQNSIQSLERLHNKLFAQFRRLVPFEASIQNYERDIEIASQEYLDILNRYNNTSMATTFVAKLKLTQEALPGALLPSKKMLLIILSGVISLVFCIIILFVLFYFDDSVQSAKQLANNTGLPVIGQLDLIPNDKLNINELWNGNTENLKFKNFKDQLRAIRLELNQELDTLKTLSVISCVSNEGKTFLSLNLAYAYAVTNKKVLLIDGNFINPQLTKSLKSSQVTHIEDFLLSGEFNPAHEPNSAISIMGNKGGGKSILELADQAVIESRFEQLKSLYDLIIIEVPALSITESSKEWILLTEKVLGVFEFKEYITDIKTQQISYIKSLDTKFAGWVFNKIPSASPSKSFFKKA
ncbi:MAG: lipopolysaccharide biosynthesis protein [Sphingobacteriaceae bacterium]|nr:lipopolysaccharide biosynthesis protein [Sphingobacteriaceae bacterium]